MANCDQVDELVSLEAAYAGDEDVCLHLPAADAAAADEPPELAADITLDLGKLLTLRAGGSEVSVASLPLRFRAVLPPEYLAADGGEPVPPRLELSAAWLPREMRQRLCEELDGVWCAQAGAPVIFAWIEWLRTDACTSLALGAELDVEPQDADVATLAAWDRERRPDADRGETPVQCDHCALPVARRSVHALGRCQHALCGACLGIVVRLHEPSAVLHCPLQSCQAPIAAEIAQAAREAPEPEDVAVRIVGKPLESSVVFCPCCEDLGMDTPVPTSGDGVRLAAGVLEACKCPKCEWSFCGVCRSPCHPSEACVADAGRAKRLLQRRPPLPPGGAREKAQEIVGQAGAKEQLARQKDEMARQAEALKAQAVAAAQQAAARPKKTALEVAEVEAKMLLKLDKRAVTWFDEGDSGEKLLFAGAQDKQDVPDDYDSMRWGLMSLYYEEICASLQKEFAGAFQLRPLAMARDVCKRFMQEVDAHPMDVIRPAYHGSRAGNYSSICRRGLLIPGEGNELHVVNGSAHGRGVYTANVDSAWLSVGFCDEPHLLVCAVLDSSCVRHVGDAMVVGRSSHVVPIFEAYGECFGRVRGRRAGVAVRAAQVNLLAQMLSKQSAALGASATSEAGQPGATTVAAATAPLQRSPAAEAPPPRGANPSAKATAAAPAAAPAQKAKAATSSAAKAPKKKSFAERLAAKSQKFH